MKPVSIYCKSVQVNLDTGPDIRDITSLLEYVIHDSQVAEGSLCATMVGSTGSLTTIEYEPGSRLWLSTTITTRVSGR